MTVRIGRRKYRWNPDKMHPVAFWIMMALIVCGMIVCAFGCWAFCTLTIVFLG